MQWPKAFAAGFVSTLIFHQAIIAVFYLAGMIPAAPYNMAPTEPLGVPQVVSLAFWGGVWGLPIWWLIRRLRPWAHWVTGIVAGAVGPTAVAMLVVFPLKGLPVSAQMVVGGLIVNAVWGVGFVVIMRLMHRRGGASAA